jgi:hypothetical protein
MHCSKSGPFSAAILARATVLARRGRGRLGKLLEQLAHLLRRHADAGVGDRKRDPFAAVLLSLASGDGDGCSFR